MPFRSIRQWLKDILEAVRRIESYTAGMDFESFRESPIVIDAVERNLHQRLTNLRLRSRANLPQKGTNIETGPRYRDHSGCEVVCVE